MARNEDNRFCKSFPQLCRSDTDYYGFAEFLFLASKNEQRTIFIRSLGRSMHGTGAGANANTETKKVTSELHSASGVSPAKSGSVDFRGTYSCTVAVSFSRARPPSHDLGGHPYKF